MSKPRPWNALLAAALLALAVLAAAPWVARAAESVAEEEQQGAELLRTFERGKHDCDSLSDTDFERIGEHVMGRMAGSTDAHESMNEAMADMMGEDAEEAMHVALGERFTGCGRGEVPGGFGQMMGMMMGGWGGFGPGPAGSMMGGDGFARFEDDDDDDWSAAAIVMTVLMVLLVVGVGVALVALLRPRARSGAEAPLDILDARFARGEIDADEYERRRQALGG